MNGWAKGRMVLAIAAVVAALSALAAAPSFACDTTTGCPPGTNNTDSTPANMLPTYPDAAQEKQQKVDAPVNLRKFSKKQSRSARRAQSRKALAAKNARNNQLASKKAKQRAVDEEEERALAPPKSAKATPAVTNPKLANAKAELTETDVVDAKPAEQPIQAETVMAPEVAGQPTHSSPPTPNVELVEAEHFNDVDRAAWETAQQQPRLMQLASLDSHAELRTDDSKWNQTSTIGRLFVALGALLTIGSAIRMFMA